MLALFALLFQLASAQQSGIITSVAGNFRLGDGGPASQAAVVFPGALAVSPDNSACFNDVGNARIRCISPEGIIRTVLVSELPSAIAIDPERRVVFTFGQRIQRANPDGSIFNIAGTGVAGFSGENTPAGTATVNAPTALAFDSTGTLIFTDRLNHRIRAISPNGVIRTLAGRGQAGFSGDEGQATQATLNQPSALALDPNTGAIVFADVMNFRIRRVAPDGVITTIAGNGINSPAAEGAALENPVGSVAALSVAPSGDIYFVSNRRERIYRIADGVISLFSGRETPGFAGDNGPAAGLQFQFIHSLTADLAGNLYISDVYNHRIRRIDAAGIGTTLAGTSLSAGQDGPGAFARLLNPSGLMVDPSGNVLVTEVWGNRIRRISPGGTVSTFAGTGIYGFEPEGEGPASLAAFRSPARLAADPVRRMIYVSDLDNHCVRQITEDGTISTKAGICVRSGFAGDGGPATEALLTRPLGLAVDSTGALFISDLGNRRIRRVDPDGIITTIAGTGVVGASGDNGPAIRAEIAVVDNIAFGPDGYLYLGDTSARVIRRISPAGIISTFVSGVQANGLTFDRQGNILFTDGGGGTLRKVTPSGNVVRIAGAGGQGFTGDGGPALNARFWNVFGVGQDDTGSIYLADSINNRIRRIAGTSVLRANPSLISFSFARNANAQSRSINITASDREPYAYRVSSTAAWLTVSVSEGSVNSDSELTFEVTANPESIAPGSYNARIILQETTTLETVLIPVNMTVSAETQRVILSQTTLLFTAVTAGVAPPPQSIRVVSTGSTAANWRAAIERLSGETNWLTATPTSGRSTTGEPPPSLDIRANPAGLPAGAYFGTITVTLDGGGTPQIVTVILSVRAPDDPPLPDTTPLGLLFTSDSVQTIEITNVARQNATFSARPSFSSQSWFTLSSTNGTLPPGQAQRLEVKPNLAGLAPGIYRAEIVLTFAPLTGTRTVSLLLVIPGAPASQPAARTTSATCVPRRLLPLFRSPGASFSVPAGWPIPVDVQVVDDCGQPLTRGQVTATAAGDPPINLVHIGAGRWTGTLVARSAIPNVSASARTPPPTLEGTISLSGSTERNVGQPLILPNGITNRFDSRDSLPVSPGAHIRIRGEELAGELTGAPDTPYPVLLADSAAFVSGVPIPLIAVNPTEILGILPFDLPRDNTYQMIVRRGTRYSAPVSFAVTTAQPTIVDPEDQERGYPVQIVTDSGAVRADIDRPARPQERIRILAAGLGSVDLQVTSGALAPSDPTAKPLAAVSLTVQDTPAEITEALLTPGLVGLYSIYAVVPSSITADPAARVVLTVAGAESQVVTMAVLPEEIILE
ncbi:MAG: hypothetical protein JNK87_11895 [Bryobacterales bacterium]|nr:hypothetical protein [Bryobacterales bacterium]